MPTCDKVFSVIIHDFELGLFTLLAA